LLWLVDELAKLELQYEKLEPGPTGGFSPHLARTLKQEDWYLVAKHAAGRTATPPLGKEWTANSEDD